MTQIAEPDALLTQLMALHVPTGPLYCGATSDGPLEREHAFSGETRRVLLTCTELEGHDGNHVDGRCCWRPHHFTAEEAVPGPPRTNFRVCAECRSLWPCSTNRILTEADLS